MSAVTTPPTLEPSLADSMGSTVPVATSSSGTDVRCPVATVTGTRGSRTDGLPAQPAISVATASVEIARAPRRDTRLDGAGHESHASHGGFESWRCGSVDDLILPVPRGFRAAWRAPTYPVPPAPGARCRPAPPAIHPPRS